MQHEEFFIVEHATDPRRKIIYAPLRSYLALVSTDVATVVSRSGTSHLRDSFLSHLAQRPRIDMQEVLQNLHKAAPRLSLAITDNCNLRCVYCHASAGEAHKQITMSEKVIEAVLAAYFKFINGARNVGISFNGGGEPTFAFKELKFAISTARRLAAASGIDVSFVMATNGFYGDEIRRYIVENSRGVSFSLDGPDFIQNRHRPTACGSGSFQRVYESARYFRDHGFPFAFRATVSSFSLPFLKEVVDFILAEFPGKSIGLEHLNPFGRGAHSRDPSVGPPDAREFTEALVQLLTYVRQKDVKVLNSATTEYNLVRPVFCSNVGVPNWTVSTTGDVTACGRDNAPVPFLFGRFDESSGEIILDRQKIAKLHSFNVLEYPECSSCFCKYQCAGDCPDRRLADKFNCEAIRRIGREVLTQFVDPASTPQPRPLTASPPIRSVIKETLTA